MTTIVSGAHLFMGPVAASIGAGPQLAPGTPTPGVLIAIVWVVPLTIVAHDGSASSAKSAPKTMRTVDITQPQVAGS